MQVIPNDVFDQAERILEFERAMPRVLPEDRNLPPVPESVQTQRFFDVRREFFEHEHFVNAAQEVSQHDFGDRIGADLLQRNFVLQAKVFNHLNRVGVSNAAGDDAFSPLAGSREERRISQQFLSQLEAFNQFQTHAPGVGRYRHVTRRILLELDLVLRLGHRAVFHHAAAVADAGGRSHDHGQAGLLGEREGIPSHAQPVLWGGGIEDRVIQEAAEMPLVLLVRAGERRWVARRDNDHATLDADIGHGRYGVIGVVQPQVLHAAHGSRPGQARSERNLHGHLFVYGVLEGNVSVFGKACERIADLR